MAFLPVVKWIQPSVVWPTSLLSSLEEKPSTERHSWHTCWTWILQDKISHLLLTSQPESEAYGALPPPWGQTPDPLHRCICNNFTLSTVRIDQSSYTHTYSTIFSLKMCLLGQPVNHRRSTNSKPSSDLIKP